MATNTVNTRIQATGHVTPGLDEKVKDFFLSIAEWVDELVASPKSLDLYDEEVREHISVRERAEIDAHFMGL